MEQVVHSPVPAGAAEAPVAEVAVVRGAQWEVGALEEKASLGDRLAWAVLFAIPTAVVITAALLTPDPHGHGTHTQLGLPPCGFLVFTGFPCPGCGLTTSFSHMVRFQLPSAFLANPFGVVLFLATFATIPLAAVGFVRGWAVVPTLDRLHAEKIAIVLAVLSLVTWVIRLVIEASVA